MDELNALPYLDAVETLRIHSPVPSRTAWLGWASESESEPIMTANIDLWLKFHNDAGKALSERFAVHPFSWLRYVAFTIYGREGDILTV